MGGWVGSRRTWYASAATEFARLLASLSRPLILPLCRLLVVRTGRPTLQVHDPRDARRVLEVLAGEPARRAREGDTKGQEDLCAPTRDGVLEREVEEFDLIGVRGGVEVCCGW